MGTKKIDTDVVSPDMMSSELLQNNSADHINYYPVAFAKYWREVGERIDIEEDVLYSTSVTGDVNPETVQHSAEDREDAEIVDSIPYLNALEALGMGDADLIDKVQKEDKAAYENIWNEFEVPNHRGTEFVTSAVSKVRKNIQKLSVRASQTPGRAMRALTALSRPNTEELEDNKETNLRSKITKYASVIGCTIALGVIAYKTVPELLDQLDVSDEIQDTRLRISVGPDTGLPDTAQVPAPSVLPAPDLDLLIDPPALNIRPLDIAGSDINDLLTTPEVISDPPPHLNAESLTNFNPIDLSSTVDLPDGTITKNIDGFKTVATAGENDSVWSSAESIAEALGIEANVSQINDLKNLHGELSLVEGQELNWSYEDVMRILEPQAVAQ